MLFATKFLTFFVTPLGLAAAGILAAAGCRMLGLSKLMRVFLCLSIGGLFVLSTPIVAKSLLGSLENDFPQTPVEDLQPRDVAVVLGGVFKQVRPLRGFEDAGDAVERVLHAARLYKAGKVRHIIGAGGNLPWLGSHAPEAKLIGALLVDLGVPITDQSHDLASRNTHENALATKKIWTAQRFSSGYLITSAFHMRRALAVFKKNQIGVTPAAADYLVAPPIWNTVLDLLPNAGALELSSIYFRERVGYWADGARGWL